MGSATTLKIWREQSLLHKLIYDWIFVPIGVAIIIGIVIAVNQLFKVSLFFKYISISLYINKYKYFYFILKILK